MRKPTETIVLAPEGISRDPAAQPPNAAPTHDRLHFTPSGVRFSSAGIKGCVEALNAVVEHSTETDPSALFEELMKGLMKMEMPTPWLDILRDFYWGVRQDTSAGQPSDYCVSVERLLEQAQPAQKARALIALCLAGAQIPPRTEKGPYSCEETDFQAAKVCFEKGRPEMAKKYLISLLQKNPASIPMRQNIFRLCAGNGAIAIWEALMLHFKLKEGARFDAAGEGNFWMQKGDLESLCLAWNFYREASQGSPELASEADLEALRVRIMGQASELGRLVVEEGHGGDTRLRLIRPSEE